MDELNMIDNDNHYIERNNYNESNNYNNQSKKVLSSSEK